MKFNLATILTITTGRLLAEMGDVYKILNFMTSDNLFTHQLPRAARICTPELLLQFPQFDTPEFQFKTGELIEMLESKSGKAEPRELINGWLLKTAAEYGDEFEVKPLDTKYWYSMNPIDEAIEMGGKDKVIVVEQPSV